MQCIVTCKVIFNAYVNFLGYVLSKHPCRYKLESNLICQYYQYDLLCQIDFTTVHLWNHPNISSQFL
jgi:hypothetical protein